MKARGLLPVTLAGALLLSGCSGGSGEGGSVTSTDNTVGTSDVVSTSEPASASDVAQESARPSEGSTSEADGESDTESKEASSKPSASERYTYEDEPEPAPEVAATLCNLDADYFRNLRTVDASGRATADDSLRMSVLSLGDNLSLWNDLQRSFPEVEDDVARAQVIYDYWDEALLSAENGEPEAADEAMQSAEVEIDLLPGRAPASVDGCSS